MMTKLLFLAFMIPAISLCQKTDSLEIRLHERSTKLTYPFYGKILISNYETKEIVSALKIENDTLGNFALVIDQNKFMNTSNYLALEIQIKLNFHYEQILQITCAEIPKSIELNMESISKADLNEVRKTKKKRNRDIAIK